MIPTSGEPNVFDVVDAPEGETHRIHVWPDGRVHITIEKDGNVTIMDGGVLEKVEEP